MNGNDITSTYEDIVEIGSGGGGTVYRAFHKRLKKQVVLKRIHRVIDNMSMMRKEVDILKNLQHSYLPQVLDFLEVKGEIYTVMSFVSGKSLQEYINEGRVFTQRELIKYGMQLCSALNYLHQQNPPIIHSDVKPANVMLTETEDICLIDFNISFYLNENEILGYSGGYTSPEMYFMATNREVFLKQGKHVNQQSDIYSLGATLYYLAVHEKIQDYSKGIDYEKLEEKTSEVFAHIIEKSVRVNQEARFKSALEMFYEFQNINKKDARYKRLLFQQKMWCVAMCVLFLGSVSLAIGGIYELKNEKYEAYNKLVKEQQEQIEAGEFEDVQELFEEAVSLLPEEIETYYQTAYSFFQEKKYDKCIEFINNEVIENPNLVEEGSRFADIYYLGANACYELKEYDAAVDFFQTALQYGMKECNFYRDYAICLAYAGNTEEAWHVLDKAVEYGQTEDSIYYAKGEIAYALENQQEAVEAFRQSRACSDNEYMKMRAYVIESNILEEQGLHAQNRELLLEAQNVLSPENQLNILEKLISTDLKLGDSQGDNTYLQEAVQVSQNVIENGWGTYTTYNNLAILNQKLGQLQTAYDVLQTMETTFEPDYNLYKRYAFLEISMQELAENQNRNYTDFLEYYEKATSLYQEELQNNNSDPEMQLLDSVLEQVKKGGWLN